MGSIHNAIKEITNADADAKLVKERLEILLTAAKAKIQLYKAEINENFTNPDQVNKKQIPGLRAIRYIEQYHVASSHSFNEVVTNHLDRAIDAFFSIGVEGSDTRTSIKGGITALIQTALSAFVGTTAAGETEQKFYLVVPENNAFVRIDIACWKYTFDQTKVFAEHDSAVAYVLCKSVIDHTKLQIDELIYLASESIAQIAQEKPVDIYDLEHFDILTSPEAQRLCLRKFGYITGVGSIPIDKDNSEDDIDRVIKVLTKTNQLTTSPKKTDSSEKNKDVPSGDSPLSQGIKCSTHPKLQQDREFTKKDILDMALIRRTWTSVVTKKTGKEDIVKWYLTPEEIDGSGFKPRNTPDILAIEKYLEILIGVWHKLKEANKEMTLN